MTYLFNVLVAFDVFMSTLLGFSSADCTISACCGLALEGKRGGVIEKAVGRWLNWMSAGHTEAAILNDKIRALQAVKVLS